MKNNNLRSKKHRIMKLKYPLLIIIATLFTGIGYAQVNDVNLSFSGTSETVIPEEVFITDVTLIENDNTNIQNSKINYAIESTLSSYIELENSIDSTIQYKINLHNNSNRTYIFIGAITDKIDDELGEKLYSNSDIEFSLTGLEEYTTTIAPGADMDFVITFHYKEEADLTKNTLSSVINFRFLPIPILELNNESENYKIDNIYPGYSKEYEFVVTNYNDYYINNVPVTYSFETTVPSPLSVEIYDENNNLVTENITLNSEGIEKINQTYKLKVQWKYTDNIEYSQYQNKEYDIKVMLKATPNYEKYLEYNMEKSFGINTNVASFYFNATSENTAKIINDKATIAVKVNNYDSDIEYNTFDTIYEVTVADNDNFSVSVEDITSDNNVITSIGNQTTQDSFNAILSADIDKLNTTENLTLKITSKRPYYKEIEFPITINLQPLTISFDANGGTMTPTTISSYNGKAYGTLPTPTRSGYTFDGWYTELQGGTKCTSTTSISIEGDHTLYARWIPHLLTDYASIGDYVDYKYVYYTNVATNSSGQYIPKDEYVNWRVLSNKDEDDDGIKEIRLIPAGVPMTYVFTKKATLNEINTEVANITTNFFSTAFTTTSTTSKFYRNGFYKLLEDGTKQNITSIDALKTAFTNELTQITSSGIPKVQSITKKDIDTIVGKTTTDADSLINYYNYLLAIPAKDISGKYASYYAADYSYYSSYSEPYHLWNSYYSGAIVGTQLEHGIRPVVTLKADVVKIDGSGTVTDPYTIGV